MDLVRHYSAALARKGFRADSAQSEAVELLQRVGVDLLARDTTVGLLGRLRHRFRRTAVAPVNGAYLWGGVGRGKTFVMDLFFDHLAGVPKLRYHFHRLMYRVHRQLGRLRQHEAPLEMVAEELAQNARVICFDEFFVSDIADAMILGNLLDALFKRGVTLVATSNIAPEDLYRDGLQRARFLPAIDLIRTHTHVLKLDAGVDYRLRVLEHAEIFHLVSNPEAGSWLLNWFDALAPGAGTDGSTIEINGRDLATIRRSDGIVWFDFEALCGGPRSQDDYIEIARTFGTVMVSDMPVLDEYREDQARRFVALVDELYDRRVKLIMTAAVPLEGLYRGKRLTREFERTSSRLREMQSTAYLGAEHRP